MTRKQKSRATARRGPDERPLLSVCMIVRDEEATLERCLRSVRQVADEIVVVDTGSRDGTVEIARRQGARVSSFPWNDDFAAARNAALARASGRWILQMDADEELTAEVARDLRRLVAGAPPGQAGFYLLVRSRIIWQGAPTHLLTHRLLLFRNHRDVRYRGRIHELPIFGGVLTGARFGLHDLVAIEHHGYLPDLMERKGKDERNRRLLELALSEEPGDPFHYFNLGKHHYVMGRFAAAVEPLRHAAALCQDASTGYLQLVYASLVLALSRSGRGDEVSATVAEAERRLPWLSADFCNNAGAALQEVGRLDQALEYYQRAVEQGKPTGVFESDPAAYSWKPRVGMAAIHEARGELHRARAEYVEALALAGEHAALSARLAGLELRLGEPARALELAARALAAGPMSEEQCWDLLELCERLAGDPDAGEQNRSEIERVAGELLARIPLGTEADARLAAACARFGQPERGLAAATAALERGEDVAVRINRGICHFALGQYREAEADFTAALAADPNDPRVLAGLGLLQPRPSSAAVPGVPSLEDVCRALVHQQETHGWLRDAGVQPPAPAAAPASGRPGPSAPVSIVIPVRDGVQHTRRCLEAIIENTPEELYEVVLVDNGTTDDTREFLALLGGDVRIVTNAVEVDLLKACRQGIRAARGKYAALVHHDAEPMAGWLESLIALAEAEGSLGAVAARVVSADDRPAREEKGPDEAWFELESCPTTAVLLRMEVAEKALQPGGGSTRTEDNVLDIAPAVRRAGYRVCCQPASLVIHHAAPGACPDASPPPSKEMQPVAPTASSSVPSAPTRYYQFARPEIQELVPRTARTILDVGCAAGALGRALKARQGCEVTGIELVPEVAAEAAASLDRVYAGEVERVAPQLPEAYFDCIILADVLEHLADPGSTLAALRPTLAPGGRIVASVPNVRHWSVVRGLLEGRWDYEEAGLLDRTHLRFFTRASFEKLLTAAGFRPLALQATAVPQEPLPASIIASLRGSGLEVSTLAEESQVYQFLYVAELVAPSLTSIIILAHDQWHQTEACLLSLARHTPEPHEIIVVDNGSTDGTAEGLRAHAAAHPNLRVISNASNRGFAAGNNQGLAAASGDYLVLLNNDTMMTEGWLGRLLDVFRRQPGAGLVGPMSNYVTGPQLVPDARYRDHAEMQAFAARWAAAHAGQTQRGLRLVGFCLGIRRAVVDRIGGLDEDFGSGNFEDDDYCLRAALAGFESWVAQDVFIHHAGSQTFKGAGIDYRQSLLRNWEIFKRKWGIPADTPIEAGYRMPARIADPSRLCVALPQNPPKLAVETEPALASVGR